MIVFAFLQFAAFAANELLNTILKGAELVMNYSELPQFATSYLTYVEVVKGRSHSTTYGYYKDIKLFLSFIKIYFETGKIPDNDEVNNKSLNIQNEGIELIKRVTFNDVLLFMQYCKNVRKNNNKTLARKSSSLRLFFKYLYVHEKLLDSNPLEQLDTPKSDKKLPKYLTLEQSIKLLSSVDGEFRERNIAILTIFLNCGIRLSELCNIDYNHINYNDNSLRIFGKGRKERIVYLNDACIAALQNYIAVRKNSIAKDKKALFISRNGNRISPRMVEQLVTNALKKSGLSGQGFSTHKLRHTAATLMYQYGNVDIRVLQALLGHENLGTTQIYTHLSNEQLRQASAASPLSNIIISKNAHRKDEDNESI